MFFNLLIISNVLLGLVLDYRPLQQGLRPCYLASNVSNLAETVLDYRPLQQGLRH